jgi:hypothetical protein
MSLVEPAEITEIFLYSGKAGNKEFIVLLCELCELCERLKK